MNFRCPLCHGRQVELFNEDKLRPYYRCADCFLVFVPKKYHLSAAEEKAHYDCHQNNPQDSGYRQFLSRVTGPLFSQIDRQAEGLDFGCGPGPTIQVMAQEAGILVHNYDLYYANRPELLKRQYQFVTLTEVIEHIADASHLVSQLYSLLLPQGCLAIMTKRVLSHDAFIDWHYKKDVTHICFYSIETFDWIAKQFDWTLKVINQDVVFFIRR